jgi:C4-dicarboxylate-specific signal transduction histidine kinase
VDACINISRRYLGFFREANESEATVRVNQVLKDLAELLRVHPAAKSNRLSLQALEADCGVAVNGTDLIQCLLNLAINALQSSERPHAVEIVARRHERPVDFELMAQAPRVRVINPVGSANQPPLVSISVMDDGDGICDGVAARLFEGYVTTKPEGEGTGLGLAIVGRIVRDCGGSIVLETAPGAGASFTLYLPALP